MQYQTHTHTHTREAHDTHCSRAFCGTLVSVPTLQLLQVVQTRLERGGGANREQRGRNEGGREKCAIHTNIETSMYRVMCQQHQK